MNRIALLVGLLVAGAGVGVGQDMPLHEIIKAGESWRTAAKRPEIPTVKYTVDPQAKTVSDGQKSYPVPLREPSCTAIWHGGGTLLVGDAGGKHIWAFRIGKDGVLDGGDQYCPLRVRKGEERSEVSALCVDRSNRVYAATKEGIQIFDPTGRMCGVIMSPTRRKITALFFVDQQLYAVAGSETYVRTMLAQGLDASK